MKYVIWSFWPAFIVAGVAEVVFFTLIDPKQLYLFGQPVLLPAIATYSIGFFMFWLVSAGSSLMSWFLLPQDIKDALHRHAGGRDDLARPKRANHVQG